EEIVAALLTDADTLAAAADGILTADEQRTLRWRRPPRSWQSARWTAADHVLLDEVAGLIERPQTYGHIVVDEAQDVSPMQARALARRVGFGSVTVLGDLAQGTTPWAARSWPALLGHLGKPETTVVPLTVGFRIPAVLVAPANRLLAALDVDVPPARSLRGDGELRIRQVPDPVAGTVEAVRAALRHEGSIGVIAEAGALPRLRAALIEAAIATADPADLGRSSARVTVLPASVAKGLEYDHVIAVEPAAIVAAETRGLHRLYVVLTRAVSRLDIVHHRPLPAELAE
ncbi:AAA family ATPase, partial [Streptomyces sp. SID3343]